ncbi:MAG: DUF222 domain-containing protein [Acidimicrobiales bacterium]
MFDAADLTERCWRAAKTDLAGASDDELLEAAVQLQRARAAFDAAEAHVLAELDVRGVCDRRYGHPTARWVARETLVAPGSVRRRVVTGRWLRQLPHADEALTDGRISFDHAHQLTAAVANPRIAEPIVAAHEPLIDYAQRASFRAFQTEMRAVVQRWDLDGGYDPDRELARNRIHLTELPDGVLGFKGEAVGEHALLLRQALEREADAQFRRHERDHDATGAELPMPPRSTLMALGLIELVRKGLARDLDDTRAPVADVTLVITAQDGPPIAVDHAAVPLPTRSPDADPTTPTAPGSSPPTDERSGHHAHDHAEPHADACCRRPGLFDDVTTPDGDPVVAEAVRHLLCDPRYVALIMNTLGVPLDVGRDRRWPTRAQRRALARRDGGCVFPGCDAPASWCDAHHVIAWEDLGPTELWNLALLCRHHHGVTHRNGWTMTATPDQRFIWTTPGGQTLHSQRHRGRSRPPSRAPAARSAAPPHPSEATLHDDRISTTRSAQRQLAHLG